MARPRAFDETEVLERAMRVFWHRGFAQTSVQDLVDALGINRASLYGTFGDKEGLYRRALCHYRDLNTARTRDLVADAPSGKTAIRRMFEVTLAQLERESDRLGCFAANAAAERGALDDDTRALLADNEAAIVATFRSLLDRAAAEGELSPERDREALARTLFALHNGINVLSRYGTDAARLRGVVEEAMRLVG